MDRLVSTTIKTNIRAENRREATFSWLDGWTQLVDEQTERSKGMTIELSNWFYEGVLMKGGVLAIDRAYFDITGGRERWLYKVARKHAGGAGEGGFAISFPTLFEKSGAEGQYRRFKFELLKLAEKNELPGYDLSVETASKDGEPVLRMRRNDAKGDAEPFPALDGGTLRTTTHTSTEPQEAHQNVSSRKLSPDLRTHADQDTAMDNARSGEGSGDPVSVVDAKALIRSTLAGLTDKATRGVMTDDTIELLRAECPGWDLYALHAEFETWVNAAPDRTPANWQKAFIGWVRRHHEKHRHQLRG